MFKLLLASSLVGLTSPSSYFNQRCADTLSYNYVFHPENRLDFFVINNQLQYKKVYQ